MIQMVSVTVDTLGPSYKGYKDVALFKWMFIETEIFNQPMILMQRNNLVIARCS